MKLKEVVTIIPVSVRRNAEFESLGLLSHRGPRLLGSLYERKYLRTLRNNPDIECVVTTDVLAAEVPENVGVAISANPMRDFYALHEHLCNTNFYWKPFRTEIDAEARVHSEAFVADRNVTIGSGSIIEPNVTIMERSIIGKNVIIRSGCVIGGEGFEFKRIGGTDWTSVSHAGGVRIEDNVELQQQCAVDRSLFGGFTTIGGGTKCDNCVHIAHNVTIGARCRIAASAMIAGSVNVGNDVWIGPSSSVSSEIAIGDGAAVTIGAVVTRNVPPGTRVTGNFAIEHKRFLSFLKRIR